MKNNLLDLKTVVGTLWLFLITITVFGTNVFGLDVPQEVVQEVTFFEVVLKLAGVVLLGALTTAINHILAFTFDKKLWWNDTAFPALIALVIAVILAAIDKYLPTIDGYIETVLQIQTDINDLTALSMIAFVLVPVVKGYLKRAKTKEKVEVKKYNK